MDTRLARLRAIISNAIDGMTPDDLARHPEGKWSSAEILEHLNLTYTGTIKSLERCLAAGAVKVNPDRNRRRWQRFVAIGLGYLPYGRTSPERVRPRGTRVEQITGQIFQNLIRMDALIEDCAIQFGSGVAISDHPVLGPLTAREWRKFHLVHGKHHAKQIVRLKQGQ